LRLEESFLFPYFLSEKENLYDNREG